MTAFPEIKFHFPDSAALEIYLNRFPTTNGSIFHVKRINAIVSNHFGGSTVGIVELYDGVYSSLKPVFDANSVLFLTQEMICDAVVGALIKCAAKE